MDHFCCVYLVFVMFYCLFIVALWSSAGKHTGQCKRIGGCYNELVVAFSAQVVA